MPLEPAKFADCALGPSISAVPPSATITAGGASTPAETCSAAATIGAGGAAPPVPNKFCELRLEASFVTELTLEIPAARVPAEPSSESLSARFGLSNGLTVPPTASALTSPSPLAPSPCANTLLVNGSFEEDPGLKSTPS